MLNIASTIQNISFLKHLQPIILCAYTGINELMGLESFSSQPLLLAESIINQKTPRLFNEFPSGNGPFPEMWFHVDT
jgi:hypothetical protein